MVISDLQACMLVLCVCAWCKWKKAAHLWNWNYNISTQNCKTSTVKVFLLRDTFILFSSEDFTSHREMWGSFTHSSHTCRVLSLGIRRTTGDWKKTILTHKYQTAAVLTHAIAVQSQLRGLSIALLRADHSHSPVNKSWYQKQKVCVFEPSIFLHCFNPSSQKAEARRSFGVPGWCTWWDLSQTWQKNDIHIQQNKAQTKQHQAKLSCDMGRVLFIEHGHRRELGSTFSYTWVIRIICEMLSNFVLIYRASCNCKSSVAYFLTACIHTYCTFPDS